MTARLHAVVISAGHFNRESRLAAENRAARREAQIRDDAAVALYRATKAARASRPHPELDAARVEFARQLDEQIAARKGGRPRLPKIPPRSIELYDALRPFKPGCRP